MIQCVYCNYNTERRYNYNKHLETMKHHKNKKRYLLQQEQKKYEKSHKKYEKSHKKYEKSHKKYEKSHKKYEKNHKCMICNYVTLLKTDYDKHCKTKNHKNMVRLNSLYEIKLKDKDDQLKDKDNQLKRKKTMNYKIKDNQLKQRDKLITELQQELFVKNKDMSHLKSKVELLSEMKDMCKKSKKSIMNIIINNYNNAPDFTAQPINDMSIKDIKRYISMGIPNGVVNMLKDHYVENIPNEQRSIWCLDASRLKYLVRRNNNWKVDLMGKIIKKNNDENHYNQGY